MGTLLDTCLQNNVSDNLIIMTTVFGWLSVYYLKEYALSFNSSFLDCMKLYKEYPQDVVTFGSVLSVELQEWSPWFRGFSKCFGGTRK